MSTCRYARVCGGVAPTEEDAGDRGPTVVCPWEEPLRERGDVTPLDVRFPPSKVLIRYLCVLARKKVCVCEKAFC